MDTPCFAIGDFVDADWSAQGDYHAGIVKAALADDEHRYLYRIKYNDGQDANEVPEDYVRLRVIPEAMSLTRSNDEGGGEAAELPALPAGHLFGCACCPPDARPALVAAACAPFPPLPAAKAGAPVETPVETPVEVAPVEVAPVEEAPAAEAPVEETPVKAPVEAPAAVMPSPESVYKREKAAELCKRGDLLRSRGHLHEALECVGEGLALHPTSKDLRALRERIADDSSSCEEEVVEEDLGLYEVLESLPPPTPAPAALPVHVHLGNAPSAFVSDSTSTQRGTKRPSGLRGAAHPGGEPKRRCRRPPQPEVETNEGRWSDAEHQRFIEAYNAMVAARVDEQNKWATVANAVGTRSVAQCRSHAQKWLKKKEEAERQCRPLLGPRVVTRFPCPAGCDRTFSHAPAAVQHGKSCMAGPDAATNEQQRFIEGHTIWTPWPTAETLAACLADREWICPN